MLIKRTSRFGKAGPEELFVNPRICAVAVSNAGKGCKKEILDADDLILKDERAVHKRCPQSEGDLSNADFIHRREFFRGGRPSFLVQ